MTCDASHSIRLDDYLLEFRPSAVNCQERTKQAGIVLLCTRATAAARRKRAKSRHGPVQPAHAAERADAWGRAVRDVRSACASLLLMWLDRRRAAIRPRQP